MEHAWFCVSGVSMSKVDKKGRSKPAGRPHVRLYVDLASSAAWRDLKPAERAVWLQIALRCNGTNNGRLAASVRDLARECNINKDTAGKAIDRLINHGLLEVAQASSFSLKLKKAAEYRVTTLPCSLTSAPPTNAWRQWRPE
jgi:hypothetical protein